MTRGAGPRAKSAAVPAFDPQDLFESGAAKTPVKYDRGETIFTQGDVCEDVFYVQSGGVKLAVLSKLGREAIVGTPGPGDFFGEGCLAGQPVRMGNATAIAPSVIVPIHKAAMVRLLHKQRATSDRFIAHMLSRNIRIEEDLVDQLFNSSEKRLARALLLLARYGTDHRPIEVVPRISQDALAQMIGTTRSRVNFFMNKFKTLGFIEYRRPAPAHDSQFAPECRAPRLTRPALAGVHRFQPQGRAASLVLPGAADTGHTRTTPGIIDTRPVRDGARRRHGGRRRVGDVARTAHRRACAPGGPGSPQDDPHVMGRFVISQDDMPALVPATARRRARRATRRG